MTLITPRAASQAGSTSGGGLMDMVKGMMGGASEAPGQAGQAGASGAAAGLAGMIGGGKKADGSVGLFDGVMIKSLIGGAVGAGIGFLPFIPGGPILGGIVGSMVGAGYGIFKNWKEMKAIKQENAAFLAAQGIQPATQQQADALLSGQPQQLLGGAPGQAGQTGQAGQSAQVDQAAQLAAAQTAAAQTGQQTLPQTAQIELDPATAEEIKRLQAQYAAQAAANGSVQASTGAAQGSGAAQVGQIGQTAQAAQAVQTTPPAVVDVTTQPATQAALEVTPKQAELAGGGGADMADGKSVAEAAVELKAKHEERIMKIWSYSDEEGKEIIMKRMQQKLEALEALVKRLQAQRRSA